MILQVWVGWKITPFSHVGVSKNSGTPKSSILIWFSMIFTIHFGVPLFLETPMYFRAWIKIGIISLLITIVGSHLVVFQKPREDRCWVPQSRFFWGPKIWKNPRYDWKNFGRLLPRKLTLLVGGLNPFEKIWVKLGSFPQIGMRIKNVWNHHLDRGVVHFHQFYSTKRTEAYLLQSWRESRRLPFRHEFCVESLRDGRRYDFGFYRISKDSWVYP